MSKRYKQPIHRDTEARTRSGLLSLFWMFVGAVIAVMVGVFLYMSPLFDGFRKEVEVNPPAEIAPVPQTPQKNEYEFYEILPKREFKGGGAGLGEQKPTETKTVPPPADIPQEDGDIEIVEENATYDDPAEPAQATPTKRYVVKVRDIEDVGDVDKLVTDLMMLGVMDVKVVHYQTDDGESVQIVSAPMSKESAYDVRQTLHQNGINAIVVEDKK
ncbi:hypothetical protein [Moraxella oblonga]|uniref:hypothetical protein n=1 Tax=Moraxella oblonga TaxID=200413 RepID=UPI000837A38A|nr:hypothetical protein [Moraxella oblonga]